MASIRTFVAFETPLEIRNEVSKLQSELKKADAGVKWEPSDKFHATIKFLGDVKEELIDNVLGIIQNIVQNQVCFEISYESLGCFPNQNKPKVIWIGAQNRDGKLETLKDLLDRQLLPLGFEIEQRKFHPHITLGRVKSDKGLKNLIPMLKSLNFEPHKAVIKEIVVMKSILKPEGSVYSTLRIIQLTN